LENAFQDYSDRSEIDGFANAARNDRYPTVAMAITKITASARTKIKGLITILY
jgi:hypothetical protein